MSKGKNMIFEYKGLEIDSSKLTIEDMPTETFREIFELCGVDVAVSLLLNFPSNYILVPAQGFKSIVKKAILKEYDNTTASIRKLARNFNVSEVYIREVLRDAKIKTPSPGQMSMNLELK